MVISNPLFKSLALLLLAGVIQQATGMGINSTMTYEYQASESAPLHFPMQIISGALLFKDAKGSLALPRMKIIANGWGDWRSSDVRDGDNRYVLPDKLKLTFFSFTENQFYQGEFDLPYEKIDDLFKHTHYSYFDNKDVTFDQFIIGVAPGGGVSVWLNALERRVEVFHSTADKIDGDWTWVVDNPEVNREAYIKEIIEYEQRTPQQLAYFTQHGVPFAQWKNYSDSRYRWKPVLDNMKLRDDLIKSIHYYNGEKDYIKLPADNTELLAIPKTLSIIWNRTGFLVDDLMIDVEFNEAEMFSTFKKIASDGQAIEMVFKMDVDNNYDFTLWLRNEKNAIELKQCRIKTWKPGGMRYENARPGDTD